MIAIRAEIDAVGEQRADKVDNPLRNAPHTAAMLGGDWPHPYDRGDRRLSPAGWTRRRSTGRPSAASTVRTGTATSRAPAPRWRSSRPAGAGLRVPAARFAGTVRKCPESLPPSRYCPRTGTTRRRSPGRSVRSCSGPMSQRRPVMERIHAATGVRQRHLALPLSAYPTLAGFGAANDVFIEVGVDLAERAVAGALEACGLRAGRGGPDRQHVGDRRGGAQPRRPARLPARAAAGRQAGADLRPRLRRGGGGDLAAARLPRRAPRRGRACW